MSNPSRRAFLAAATTTVLMPASAIAATSQPDAILAVIKNHQTLDEDLGRALTTQSDLEELLDWRDKTGKYKSDPRWIAIDTQIGELHELINLADCEMISVTPTTPEGVVALFRYVIMQEAKGNEWREHYSDADVQGGPYRSWYYHLLRNVLPVLDGLAVRL